MKLTQTSLAAKRGSNNGDREQEIEYDNYSIRFKIVEWEPGYTDTLPSWDNPGEPGNGDYIETVVVEIIDRWGDIVPIDEVDFDHDQFNRWVIEWLKEGL